MKIRTTHLLISCILAAAMATLPIPQAKAWVMGPDSHPRTSSSSKLDPKSDPYVSFFGPKGDQPLRLYSPEAFDKKPQPEPQVSIVVACGLALVVIVVGTVVVVKMVQLCNKIIPPPSTNSPSAGSKSMTISWSGSAETSVSESTDAEVYAAVFYLGPNTTDAASVEALWQSVELTLRDTYLQGGAPMPSSSLVPAEVFFGSLTNYGLPYLLSPGVFTQNKTAYYGYNGSPTSSSSSPIRYQNGVLSVVTGPPHLAQRSVVWKSSDLSTWTGVATNVLDPDKELHMTLGAISTNASGFYKVSPDRP